MITVDLPVTTLDNAASGSTAYLVDLPGWYDSADVKLRVNERHGASGIFDQDPVYDNARYFAIVGRIVAPGNPAAVFELRSTLMGLKIITGQWPVTVTDPVNGPLTANVRIAGPIKFEISDELDGWADFTIPLVARDPLKYGPTEILTTGLPVSSGGLAFPIVFPIDFGTVGNSGRVVTTNSGEAETVSLIEVTGGLGGGFSAACVELGREIRFERQIPLGSTVSVDLRTGQAFIDGQSPVSGSLTRRDWWTVPPGETRTIQFNSIGAVTGTPTLTAYTAPAYN